MGDEDGDGRKDYGDPLPFDREENNIADRLQPPAALMGCISIWASRSGQGLRKSGRKLETRRKGAARRCEVVKRFIDARGQRIEAVLQDQPRVGCVISQGASEGRAGPPPRLFRQQHSNSPTQEQTPPFNLQFRTVSLTGMRAFHPVFCGSHGFYLRISEMRFAASMTTGACSSSAALSRRGAGEVIQTEAQTRPSAFQMGAPKQWSPSRVSPRSIA